MTARAVGTYAAVSKVVTGCAGGPAAVNVGLVVVLETVGTCGRRHCAVRDVEDEDALPSGAVSVECEGWSYRRAEVGVVRKRGLQIGGMCQTQLRRGAAS